jgi:hypothetical protein
MNIQDIFDARMSHFAVTAVEPECAELNTEPDSGELAFADGLAIDFLRHGLL